MLLISGLSWKPVPAAYLPVKHHLPVLLYSRVGANQSLLYKNACYYCTPCLLSASHSYSILFISYPASPLDRSVLKKTYLSSDYRLDRYLPLPLGSLLSFAYVCCTPVNDQSPRCLVNKLIRNKIALYYSKTCYCYCSASHGYVHLYNLYPDLPIYWTLVHDPSSQPHVNKLIRNEITLCYCNTHYGSAFQGYVHFYNSYPDPPRRLTFSLNYCSASYGYVHLHNSYPDPPVDWTSVDDLLSHRHVNKLIRNKMALCHCTTCYCSASCGYVHLYNPYPVPPVKWTISLNFADTSTHCTPHEFLVSYSLVNMLTCYSSAAHGYVFLYKPYPDPPLNMNIRFNLSAPTANCAHAYNSESCGHIYLCYSHPVLPVNEWLRLIKFNLTAALCYVTPVFFSPTLCYVYFHNPNLALHLYWLSIKINRLLVFDNYFIIEEELLSTTEYDQSAGDPDAKISPENEADLLASDKEDMDVEDNGDGDDSRSAAASESYCSANSSIRDPSSPTPPRLPLSRAHNAIRVARLALMSSRSLSTGVTSPLSPVGSLAEEGDDRPSFSFMVHSFAANRNICSSFDTASLLCLTCSYKPDHKVLIGLKVPDPPKYSSPVVFVLADQSFPACFPSGGEGECFKILRLEDGTLSDLTSIFLDTVKHFIVPAGSVVLLHSVSLLAWAGPAAYCEDFVRARQRIYGVYRTGLTVMGGLPLLANGCNDQDLVQDLATVSIWMETVRNPAERDISSSRAVWRSLFIPTASKPSAEAAARLVSGQPSAPHSSCDTGSVSKPSALPEPNAVRPSAYASLEGVRPSASHSAVRPSASASSEGARPSAAHSAVRPSASASNPDTCLQPSAWLNCSPSAQSIIPTSPISYTMKLRLPASLDSQQTSVFSLLCPLNRLMVAADETTERTIIECLIRELNQKFNVGLDTNFSTSRSMELHSPDNSKETVDFVLVGSSHATRISAALTAAGEKVLCLASPTWRLTAENVAALVQSVEDAAANNPEAIFVFQLYDSSVYFCSSDSGELSLPKRGEDGKYHVVGELAFAEWAVMKKIFTTSSPLLRAAGGRMKLILSPLPRYVQGKCCEDKQHLTNYRTTGYATEMGNSLAQIFTWLGDLAHGRRILDYEVVCVSSIVGMEGNPSKKELAKLWGSDPVHLTPAGYQKVAEKMVEMADSHRTKPPRAAGTPGPKHPQKTARRPGLSRSDLTAGRWDQEAHHRSSGKRSYPGAGSGSSKRHA